MLDAVAASEAAAPPMRIFAAMDKTDVRRQAAESTARRARLPRPRARICCTPAGPASTRRWTCQARQSGCDPLSDLQASHPLHTRPDSCCAHAHSRAAHCGAHPRAAPPRRGQGGAAAGAGSPVQALARRYKAGAPLSALDGVPYAVKDCTDALPYATAGGTTYVRPIRENISRSSCGGLSPLFMLAGSPGQSRGLAALPPVRQRSRGRNAAHHVIPCECRTCVWRQSAPCAALARRRPRRRPQGWAPRAQMGALRPVARDAPLVAALRETGALLLGKTAMVEHGLSAMGLNTAAGTPRNPYNPNHLTGGSSSGSAAAVAAGLCPFAIGARPWPARLARAPGLRAPAPAQAGHARS